MDRFNSCPILRMAMLLRDSGEHRLMSVYQAGLIVVHDAENTMLTPKDITPMAVPTPAHRPAADSVGSG